MDLIDQLKSEWSKSFPDEPFPSNLSEEKNYNFVTLQNSIKNCEQTINDLNKKIQQEIFLRDFFKKFTEKFYKNENPGTRNEKKPLPPPPQPSPSTISNSKEQKSAKSLIGSLVTETLSISTLIFDENKKTTTIPSTQSPPPPPFSLNNSCSQSESITDNRILKSENHQEIIFGDKNEKLPRVKIKSEKDATTLQKDGSTKPTLNETLFGVTTATGSSKAAAVDAEKEKEAQVTLSDLKTKRKTINVLSPKSGLEHQAENNAFLRPNLSLRKSMPPPPSLPPKPKRKNLHLSNMTSSSSSSNVALSNTKVNSNNNNNNFKYCTVDESKKGNEKTTLSISSSIDEPSSSSTADLDPHLELDTTTPSVDQFCSRIEVGKCSSGLCEKDVKSGLIESGTTNKAEKKQVDTATVAADELQQPVLKQQQLGLTTTTTTTLIETHPINTTTTTTLGSEEGEKEGEKEIITNRVVKATETAAAVAATGNRHNNNKQNNNSNGGLQQQQQQRDKNYCGDDDTIQLTTIKEGLGVRPRRPQPSAGSICVDEEEKKLISGERQESQEENKKETLKNNPAFVVVGLDDRRSEKNKKKVEEEEETEEADCLESGFVGQKLTRKKKERKEEERREEEEEDKTNSQHVHDDDSAISPDYKDSKKKRLKESTSVPPFLPNNKTTSTDDTPTTSTDTMSTFKKQRDDICFVSYRKLDTEFYEPSFTGNSTLPVPERRSSLLKPTASQTDPPVSEKTFLKDPPHISIQKPNTPSSHSSSSSSLARNLTLKGLTYTIHKEDEPKKKSKSHEELRTGLTTSNKSKKDHPSPSSIHSNISSSSILDLNKKDEDNSDFCSNSNRNSSSDQNYIEVKKNNFGEYKTCIELTDDDESDSSEKKEIKVVHSGNQLETSDDEDTDEEMLSSIYEKQQFDSLEDINLLKMRKQAVRQFLAAEEIFVEILENVQKLMDQFSATIDSRESLLSKTDFEVIFMKIPEILSLHQTCVKNLTPKVQNWQNNETVGIILKELMIHFPIFEEYTKNYSFAVETINKCSQMNGVFKKIAEEASLNSEMQKSSLAVLLYKPINQLQFNTSFIQELLQYTPKTHADYEIIESTWRLTQLNLSGNTNKSDEDKAENEQYLLKSDYLVELSGNVRKLRCFFLFNDVLVCTKQRFWQKGSFDVKWFIPISHLMFDSTSDNEEMKSQSKETIDEIKRKISFLETELRKENEKDKVSDRTKEKLKKKLSEFQRELARLSGYLEFVLKHNKKRYTLLMSTDYAREEWKEALCGLKDKCALDMHFTASEVQQLVSSCKKVPNISNLSPHQQTDKIEEHGFVGSLCVTLHELSGLDEICSTFCCLELDSCGQFFTKARSVVCNEMHPIWNEEFELELDYSNTLRILCYKKGKDNQGDVLLGKSALALSKDWLSNFTRKTISMNKISLVLSINYLPPNKTIQRIPSKVKTGTFGVNIQKVAHHQNRPFPLIVSICTQEIEKRGLQEVGIYRVSGGQSDVKRLKHAFQKNSIRARKMIADPDFNIHAVAAVLKLFFRELPEPLFTNALHNKFLAINDIYDAEMKKKKVINLIHSLPNVNYSTLLHLLQHLQRISENCAVNKMTNSNLAVIFGQSLMQPAPPASDANSVEMASFLNAHLQNDVLEYIMTLQCTGVSLAKES